MVLALLCSCAVSHKTAVPPAQVLTAKNATKAQLLDQYNHTVAGLKTVNAAVEMKPSAGSAYTGIIEQYHEVGGFILAMRPADIRVIGQAPILSKDIFDMASDGITFEVFIPSKNKYIVGPANLRREAAKPIENLRPQHLVDAMLPPELPPGAPVLFEEWDEPRSRFYVLTALSYGDSKSNEWRILQKIWFDRADLSFSRTQIYGPDGSLDSDVQFAGWHNVGGGMSYPTDIQLNRPHDGYQLGIHIKHVTLNEPIAADRFTIKQPDGSELVRLGEERGGSAQ